MSNISQQWEWDTILPVCASGYAGICATSARWRWVSNHAPVCTSCLQQALWPLVQGIYISPTVGMCTKCQTAPPMPGIVEIADSSHSSFSVCPAHVPASLFARPSGGYVGCAVNVMGATPIQPSAETFEESARAAWDQVSAATDKLTQVERKMMYWLLNRKHGVSIDRLDDQIDRELRAEWKGRCNG